MKTILHAYHFDLSKPGQTEAYAALCASLKAMGLEKFDSLSSTNDSNAARYREDIRALDGKEVELEIEHLFQDQWNTAPRGDTSSKLGLRVFDWHEDIWPNPFIKTGQWLEQTDEMRALRATTLQCGYCGKQYPADEVPVDHFCNACLDSEYLKAEQLPLLRLFQVSTPRGLRRADLDEAERAMLLPRYREAQLRGSSDRGRARIEKAKIDIEVRYDKAVEKARIERDGHRWLLEHVPGVDSNAIYYAHTGRWGFGWRTPVGGDLLDQLLEEISEFPFPYDIKTTDRGTLSGER